MGDEQQKKIDELEKKIEKTNERISIIAGTVLIGGPALIVGSSLPVTMVAFAVGGIIGSASHHTRKWMKNRSKKKMDEKERKVNYESF